MSKNLRIAIACSSLCSSRGGSERAVTDIASEMLRRSHAVLLLSAKIKGGGGEPCYGLPSGARHIAIDPRGRHTDIRHLREFLIADGTDVFLSMQSDAFHLLWSVACMGSGTPFICSERIDPVIYIENYAWNRAGRLAVLAGADFIHELLPPYVDTVPEILRNKVRVMPNAAPLYSISADPIGGGHKKLLYLARFCGQKRPLMLLDAFRLVMDKHPQWNLEMWGHGPHEKRLKKQISKHGLDGRVHLRGICLDSARVLSQAQAYCLPSSFEGFPNTVLEAMSAGLPVAGFASCKGVAGVVRDGETGLLAREDSAMGLADVLDKLLGDAELRARLGKAGKAACSDYAPDKIFDQWENLFYEAAALKGNTAMDAFYQEPFASRARLSAAARREWLFRDFGEAMPYTFAWWRERIGNLCGHIGKIMGAKLGRRRPDEKQCVE